MRVTAVGAGARHNAASLLVDVAIKSDDTFCVTFFHAV